MPYFILSYPELQPEDLEFIQAIRREHDPQHALVDPHFTLVFAFSGPDLTDLVAHIKRTAGEHSPFRFHLRRAAAVLDSFTDTTHVFLIPEQGNAELVALHDDLYTGLLAGFLRSDLPYVPHITVAAKVDPAQADRLARQINTEGVSIEGEITRLTLVERTDGGLKDISSFPLEG